MQKIITCMAEVLILSFKISGTAGEDHTVSGLDRPHHMSQPANDKKKKISKNGHLSGVES